MQEQEIIHYLRLLGEELGVRRPVQLLMIGGAYMITQLSSRLVTEDVDVLVRLDRYSSEYQNFRDAIRYVAQDAQVSQKWLSVNVGDFMTEVGKVPHGKLWFEHGKLKMYVPDPQYVLVLKVLAARRKDMADLQFLFLHLRLTERKQVERLLRKYVNRDMLEDEEYSVNIERILSTFFG